MEPEVLIPVISGLITLILIPIGKWYLNQINAKIKAHDEGINELQKQLELNNQADEFHRGTIDKAVEEIKQGQNEISQMLHNFLNKYSFILDKLRDKEIGS